MFGVKSYQSFMRKLAVESTGAVIFGKMNFLQLILLGKQYINHVYAKLTDCVRNTTFHDSIRNTFPVHLKNSNLVWVIWL